VVPVLVGASPRALRQQGLRRWRRWSPGRCGRSTSSKGCWTCW
jgi:hypothetical protein